MKLGSPSLPNVRVVLLVVSAIAFSSVERTQGGSKTAKERADLTWTDPETARTEDHDFLFQGEYGASSETSPWGVQVVALGDGQFDAYLLEGGLPGVGWEPGRKRIRLSGSRSKDSVRFESDDGETYLVIQNGTCRIHHNEVLVGELRRIERKSPTLGAKPPKDAIVLFDGSSPEQWIGGQVENGLLKNTDISSKERFHDYSLHLEFRTPYKPYARGQQRGNSGIYHQGRFETQVLDSFGLEGNANECGGIYSIAAPRLNACLPPLSWQTYDVDFTAANVDDSGTVLEPAQITVRLNGILVHDKQSLPHTTTAAPVKTISAEPGPFFIQYHKNPVYYRNIWVLPQ